MMSSDIPQTLSSSLPTGYELQEYTILSVLGMGGFGITYLATDNHLQLKVAIKEFFPSSLAVRNHSSGSVAINSEQSKADFIWGKSRFIQEAQTLARFTHKNIVQVYRFFEANETSYMVMVYEEGQSLEAALTYKTIEWNEINILELLLPLLDGLKAIHVEGFLHRDIKPANIILRSKDQSPVLLDFGSARSAVSTQTMTAVVSPGYGPVEQYYDQGSQGPWSDIYSMAAVLYRVVSGCSPIPAPQRVKKDALLPAVFAGRGRYSQHFLKAIDTALMIDEIKRPQNVDAWLLLLVGTTSNTDRSKVIKSQDTTEILGEIQNISKVIVTKKDTVEATDQTESISTEQPAVFQEFGISTKGAANKKSLTRVTNIIKLHPIRLVFLLLMVIALKTQNFVPWSDTLLFIQNPSDYSILRYRYQAYILANERLQFNYAYEYLTPEIRKLASEADYITARRNAIKLTLQTEKFRGLDLYTGPKGNIVSAAVSSTVVIDDKENSVNTQRWVKIEDEWYRDLLNDHGLEPSSDKNIVYY